MSKVYILVRETGSYDDVRVINMEASKDRELIYQLKEKLEADAPSRKEAYQKLLQKMYEYKHMILSKVPKADLVALYKSGERDTWLANELKEELTKYPTMLTGENPEDELYDAVYFRVDELELI